MYADHGISGNSEPVVPINADFMASGREFKTGTAPSQRRGKRDNKCKRSRDCGKASWGAQNQHQQLQSDQGEANRLKNIDLQESLPGIWAGPAKVAQRVHGDPHGIPKKHEEGETAKAFCDSRAKLQMPFPAAKRRQRKAKARQGHEHRSGKPAAEEPIVVPGSKLVGRGKKNVESMALYHQDHRKYTDNIYRNEARRGIQIQRLCSKFS